MMENYLYMLGQSSVFYTRIHVNLVICGVLPGIFLQGPTFLHPDFAQEPSGPLLIGSTFLLPRPTPVNSAVPGI